ncbi:TetR/AcrR family transcriptional regulator [Subtercola vilae]|uniref:TetR/AcrR family transcriptional regulator n=1 Tax=Subtercola vilae TaxID=2056433 RepID=UPI00308444FB
MADRAGVNQRTFFRHFPDKREVLFGGQDDLHQSLIASVIAEPDGTPPVDVLRNALLASTHVLEDNKEAGATRLRIIAETPALLERDLAKGAAMASALADALCGRGETRDAADLVGAVCWATFHHAAAQWIATPGRTLDSFVTDAFDLLSSSVNRSARSVL